MIKSILGGKSKNLFDISKADVVIHSDMSFSSNVSYNSHFYSIPVEAGQTYTVSYDIYAIEGGGIQIGLTCQTGDFYQDGVLLFLRLTPDSSINNWKHITNTFTIPSGATKITFSSLKYPDYPKYFRNFQIELGSTATEYVPHELTSYKSIMKVSDVMQVVDKPVSSTGASLVGTSRTMSGITCHYLEDGTGVTLTGTTSTAYAIFEFGVYKKPIIGHKYLWFYQHSNASDVINRAYIEFKYIDKDGKGHWFSGTEQVYTLSEYAEKFEFHPIVIDNTTCNGFTFKPQLFDLTEMFGAGNEPKTVAEFKAKFPNDYYPYSPSCFVTSFDKRMPCKTKNLFSSSTEVGIPSSTKSDSSEKRLLEDGKWYIGLSKNNYYRGPQSDWPGNFQYNIWENSISIYTKLEGYGLAKCIYVEPNTKYTISCKVNGPDINIGCGFYQEDGTFINFFSGKEITTPQNCKFMIIVFSLGIDKNKVTHYVSDIQLVKGTTATDYVPYGYV